VRMGVGTGVRVTRSPATRYQRPAGCAHN
jgi:hypothetical protein